MKLTIKLFAAARQAVGTDEVEITLPAAGTVQILRDRLRTEYPALDGLLDHAMFAVDQQYVGDDHRLNGSEEIACILPVSGG